MPEPVVWYWVTPDRGYIKSAEGSGGFFRQQDAPFTSASLQVPVSVLLHGYSDYFFIPKQDSHLGIGRRDGTGNFVLTTSDVDVKDTAEPIKMDIVCNGTYTIDHEVGELFLSPMGSSSCASTRRRKRTCWSCDLATTQSESAQRSSLRFLQIEFDWLGVYPRFRRGKCTYRLEIVMMAVVRN
jgi:hypothetical protein